jgi:pterin-4a-carbinolamine dehydratase
MSVKLGPDEYVVKVAAEAIEALKDWHEIEGVKLKVDPQTRRLEILMTKDVALARFVDEHNEQQSLD